LYGGAAAGILLGTSGTLGLALRLLGPLVPVWE